MVSFPEDIYDFGETGIAMGLTATAKVIARAEYHGRRSVLQAGSREWVTAIESIRASGWGFRHLERSYTIVLGARIFLEIGVSKPAQMDRQHKIRIRWLQELFIPSTNNRTQGRYRLLVLNSDEVIQHHRSMKFTLKTILSQYACQRIPHTFYNRSISDVSQF
jgi:hypothetical protein